MKSKPLKLAVFSSLVYSDLDCEFEEENWEKINIMCMTQTSRE